MTRLRHSAEGYRRSLQLSSASLFILVEGPSDVYFYSRIADAAALGTGYEVRMARELPGETGGKDSLLGYYDHLRRQDSLCSELAGKRTAVIFLLDKDADDVLRSRRRSEHVVYTDYYSRENYLFVHGAVESAMAAMLGLAIDRVTSSLPPNWRLVAAASWRDWIIVCLLTRVLNVSAESNFGVPSRINKPCVAAPDLFDFEARLERLRAAANVAVSTFASLRRRVTRLVDARLAAGLHDTVFAGKWYATFLRHWLTVPGIRTWSDRELESVLLASLDYSSSWASRLRARMSTVVQRCQLSATG
jgi:hypothetical protein